ncbi:MAG: hypothetical protein HQM16_08350 [Deltaproteobacteria bacterium]|nr:hypothetical protein [Deltaproteobacteria bacterium]
MKYLLSIFIAVLLAANMAGCSSSGDAAGDGGNAGGDETVTEINDIGDIPLDVVDPSEYDVSLVSASLNLKTKYVQPGAVGGFSRAGCESDQQRNRIIYNSKLPEVVLCYMQILGDQFGLEFGDGVYNYYDLSSLDVPGGPEQAGGSMSMKIALKKVDDTITMIMCEGGSKMMEFEITANETYAGHVINKFNYTSDGQPIQSSDRIDFNADGPPENFTTASFSQTHNSSEWGYGSETLAATPDHATVSGYFANEYEGQDFSGAGYARFDALEGTAKFASNGTFPAMLVGDIEAIDEDWYNWLTAPVLGEGQGGLGLQDADYFCCDMDGCEEAAGTDCTFEYSDLESFSITASGDDLVFAVIEDAASSYYETVNAATLATVDDAPTIEFTNTDFADCSATSWTTWTFGAPPTTEDLATCDAIEAEMNNFNDSQGCEQLQQQEQGQEQGQ